MIFLTTFLNHIYVCFYRRAFLDGILHPIPFALSGAQYPVFPWVLADYSSARLDLTRAATFRDLRFSNGNLWPGVFAAPNLL